MSGTLSAVIRIGIASARVNPVSMSVLRAMAVVGLFAAGGRWNAPQADAWRALQGPLGSLSNPQALT